MPISTFLAERKVCIFIHITLNIIVQDHRLLIQASSLGILTGFAFCNIVFTVEVVSFVTDLLASLHSLTKVLDPYENQRFSEILSPLPPFQC